jgi:membrane-associated phospholipid phosphatase
MFRFLLCLLFLILTTHSDLIAKKRTAFTIYGDVFQIFIPVSAVTTALYKDDTEGCLQLAKSFAASLLTTTILRATIRSKRPNGRAYNSFPSQHTSASFTGAGFYGSRYGWKYGVPAYTAASLVGYSRIKAKAHYAMDVIGGAAVSLGFNFLFVKPYEDPAYMKTPVLIQPEAEGYKETIKPNKTIAKKPSADPLAKKMRNQYAKKTKKKKN